MRYTQEYKDSAKQRLVAAGGSHAKQHGFGVSGMADLAAAAGVTTGSLYKHFGGKADLFASLISAELKRTAQMYDAIDPADRAGAVKSITSYLSLKHVQHPERGCPLPSLTSEVARADPLVRDAFQQGMQEIHANVKKFTGSADDAWTLIAQNVGAVMIARALSDEKLQRELLAALRRSAERLLNKESEDHTGRKTL
ncbi:MAG: TetR/AcrR family transcriptional regulator [Polaromonas sp.]|uniref:TetR/AcrR family transcriptional regulator n=1 Tax=Polaromonas sp. TaxID=1869339 RepID=UPI0017CC0492|nr:TetR/AcrR family transcriptional regulator [Polaromonas sp.]MBA3595281.1 TetR/AcrR family transcriptional regulator [Polaromonas sp.]